MLRKQVQTPRLVLAGPKEHTGMSESHCWWFCTLLHNDTIAIQTTTQHCNLCYWHLSMVNYKS